MNDIRNRDRPANQMTKREEAAIRLWAQHRGVSAEDAVRWADELFDELEDMPELQHPFDEPDFDHAGTP